MDAYPASMISHLFRRDESTQWGLHGDKSAVLNVQSRLLVLRRGEVGWGGAKHKARR